MDDTTSNSAPPSAATTSSPQRESPSGPTHPPLPRLAPSFGWLLLFLLAFVLASVFYIVGYSAMLGFEYGMQGIADPDTAVIEARVQAHIEHPDGMTGLYLMQLLMLLPLILLAAHFPQQPWRQTLAFNPIRARDLRFWALIWFGYFVVQYLLTRLFDIDPGDFMRSLSGSRHFPITLVLIFCAPLLEELIFRGYLFKAWRHSRLGLSGTLLLTSLLFTSLHAAQYDWAVLTFIFSLSIILGLAREKTGSIWVPLVIHALNNLVAAITVIYLGWL